MRTSALIIFVFLLGCHPTQPLKPSASQLRCLSYEEPACSACFAGEAESCEALAGFYQDGQEIQRSFTRAAYFWRQAQPLLENRCDAGGVVACEKAGLAYWEGITTRQDSDKARRYFEAAEQLAQKRCEGGAAEGCLQLASLYQREGFAAPRKEYEAYQKALQLGEGVAVILFKEFWLRYYKDEKDFPAPPRPSASPLYEKSCQQGDLRRCVLLGGFYEDAAPKQAEELYEETCKKGEGEACYRLAVLLSSNLSLLQQSCALHFEGGCRALLSMKESAGSAVAALQEPWRNSCLQGNAASCEHLLRSQPKGSSEEIAQQLARLYEEDCALGIGKSCYRWFRADQRERATTAPEARPRTRLALERGCAAGDASDCLFLGVFLIPKESPLAVEAIERSCALGSLQACQQLSSGWAWAADAAQQKVKKQYYTCRAQALHPFMPDPSPCELPEAQ